MGLTTPSMGEGGGATRDGPVAKIFFLLQYYRYVTALFSDRVGEEEEGEGSSEDSGSEESEEEGRRGSRKRSSNSALFDNFFEAEFRKRRRVSARAADCYCSGHCSSLLVIGLSHCSKAVPGEKHQVGHTH